MKTVQGFVKAGALLACATLFNVGAAPGEAAAVLEERELVTRQQCRVDEHAPLLLVHGRPRHSSPHPPHYHPLPPYPPPVYPPYGPYYSPYPAAAICRNQLRFCYLNVVMPVGAPCVCAAPVGGVWFSGWVTFY